jgi:hypothetical protein
VNVRLSTVQAEVMAQLKAGATLYYQPQRAWVDRHYFMVFGDGTRVNVTTRTGNALVEKGYIHRVADDEPQAFKRPWRYAVAERSL